MTLHTRDVSEQRQHVYAYIDHLPGDQLSAACGLLETMRSRLDRTLALAPADDEPVTTEDLAAIQADIASLDAGCGVLMEETWSSLGSP